MKNITSLLSLLFIVPITFANVTTADINTTHTGELGWVDEQIRAIIPARIGISDQLVNTLKEPFKYKSDANATATATVGRVSLKSYFAIKKAPKPPLVLNLIINSKALISGKWYKVGDKVEDYNIKCIESTSVTLTNSKGIKVLSIKSDNYIKIQTK